MFRNVLVGVDGSASADRALREAIDVARESSGRLGILAVVPALNWWASTAPFTLPVSRTQLSAELEAEARRHVEEADEAIPDDVPVTKLVAHANEAGALLTHALHGPWDLIVVGRRSSFDRRTLRGRLGARLARRSPVPVLIVPASPSLTSTPSGERLAAHPRAATVSYRPPDVTAPRIRG